MISAAGTGGHITPGLAVAELLVKQGITVCWVGGRRPLEKQMVQRAGLAFYRLSMRGMRGRGWKGKLGMPFRLCIACLQALYRICRFRPQVVISFGGYVTLPVGIASFICRRPLFIHEQNAIAGMSNLYLARIASGIFSAFPGAFKRLNSAKHTAKIKVVGNPLAASFLNNIVADKHNDQPPEKQNTLHILVLGGSQGAAFLNSQLPEALVELLKTTDYSVWHQAGKQQATEVEQRYLQMFSAARLPENIQVSGFIEHMWQAYSWADCVICRAGALTVSELIAVGLPAICIPFPHAVDDHQTLNAKFLMQQNAAYLMPQNSFSASTLVDYLRLWHTQPSRRLQMAHAASNLACLDAAGLLWENVLHALDFT